MKLTAAVYRTGRTILFEEAHSLVAGDLLEPFVLDFSHCGGATPDTDTLTLVLKRSRTGATVLSVPMFSEVPNHRFLRQATVDLSVSAMGDWYAEEAAGPSPSRKCVEGWLEISDRNGTWVSCPVPVVLRDVTPRGDVAGYYTASQVDALLELKQGKLTFDQSPSQGSANPVTSGGVFSVLAQKADASALASLAAHVSSLPSMSSINALLASKADSDAVAASLALKADKATTYTKSEVDSLVKQGGATEGQPGVTFLGTTDASVTISYGEDTLAKVVLVARDGTAVKRVVVEGIADPYAGTHVLDAKQSWSSASAGGGTVSFLPATSSFRFSYGGASVDVPCTLPQSLGTPMSDLADVFPTVGQYDRAVSSGGVVDHVEDRVATRVSNELHLEDLHETRLITAQNATSCAEAVRAVTELTAMIIGLEQTFAKKAVIDAMLALKAEVFTVKSPLSLKDGVLSVDLDTVGGGGASRPFHNIEPSKESTWELVTGAVNTIITDGMSGEVHLTLSLRRMPDDSSRWFRLTVYNPGPDKVTVFVDHIYDYLLGGPNEAYAVVPGTWDYKNLVDVLADLGISGTPILAGAVRTTQVAECSPTIFTIMENY